MDKDYYKILGVSSGSSRDEIKRAYRRLAHQYHPDKKGGDEAKFKEINEAYQVLSDERKRAQYDQFGSAFEGAGRGFGGFDFSHFWNQPGQGRGKFSTEDFGFEDIFGDVFEGFGLGGKKRNKRGQDISVDIEITLEEAFGGLAKDLELKKYILCDNCNGTGGQPGTKFIECSICGGRGEVEQIQRSFIGAFRQVRTCGVCLGEGKKPEKICKKCSGEGRVVGIEKIAIKIPAGVSHGEILKIEARGEMGARGLAAGDLYVKIYVRRHQQFKRDGDDIYISRDISFTQAALGDTIEVLTLGGKVDLKIPPGIESDKLLRLKEKGMPHLYGGGRGDQYVKIRVITPKKLNKRQKELIERLKEEGL